MDVRLTTAVIGIHRRSINSIQGINRFKQDVSRREKIDLKVQF